MRETLAKDPYNIVITGVGGQGNVIASRVLSNMLVRRVQGDDRRLGMSAGRSVWAISGPRGRRLSPQIPRGADLIVAIGQSGDPRLAGAESVP
jgi:indolepyruvate ferredoxin oxidoreductase beta subunit